MKKRNIKNRVALIATITTMSLTGCTNTGSVKPTVEPTSSTEIETLEQSINETNIGGNPIEVGSNVAETSEIETTEEETTEEKTSEVETTEEETTIDENLLIEQKIDTLYNEYKEYYQSDCIDKDELRNCYYILNNKLFDENGKKIINGNVEVIYTNIGNILFSINMYELASEIDIYEMSDVQSVTPDMPSLLSLMDLNDDEPEYLINKIKNYESFRSALVEDLNNKTYNIEMISNYLSTLENNNKNEAEELEDNLTYQFISSYIDFVSIRTLYFVNRFDQENYNKLNICHKKMANIKEEAIEQTEERLNAKTYTLK